MEEAKREEGGEGGYRNAMLWKLVQMLGYILLVRGVRGRQVLLDLFYELLQSPQIFELVENLRERGVKYDCKGEWDCSTNESSNSIDFNKDKIFNKPLLESSYIYIHCFHGQANLIQDKKYKCI